MVQRKHLLLLRSDLVCTKRTSGTGHLASMQINRFPGNTENIQARYEKLFYSVSTQFLSQFFWILHQPSYLVYQGYVC